MIEWTGDQIVEHARGWIDTPFRWQKSTRGKGCDCKGLVAGVAREMELPGHDDIHALMSNYGRVVDAALLHHGLKLNLDQTHRIVPGSVLLIKIMEKPQHLAIASYEGRMIHCLAKGVKRVRDVPIEGYEIASIWLFRGVRYG